MNFILFSLSSKFLPEIENEIANAEIPNDPVESRKALKNILDKYQSLSGKNPHQSFLEANSENIKYDDIISPILIPFFIVFF